MIISGIEWLELNVLFCSCSTGHFKVPLTLSTESLQKGILSVMTADHCLVYEVPNSQTFVCDMQMLFRLMDDGPLKNFCFQQLNFLSSRFNTHIIHNKRREQAAQKAARGVDLHSVKKVHIFDMCNVMDTATQACLRRWTITSMLS